jgi:hypothetical protein
MIYADPGLLNNLGHHANSCRTIRHELTRRGINVTVLSNLNIVPALREELEALPLFRAFTYRWSDDDPICGWLNSFDVSVRATVEDLSRVNGIKADDIIYLNSAQPAQFMALATWAKFLPMERRPHIVLEFGTDPGVDVEGEPGAFAVRPKDYRIDPRAMFYRHAAGRLDEADLARFHMVTFDSASSEVYSQVLGKPVGVLPPPRFARRTVTSRVGRRPITVSVLGHQRPDKGYHLMPEVARLLLAQEPEIKLILHNAAPDEMVVAQRELRECAAIHGTRVTLDERTAEPALWEALLRRSDLVLCPYDPARFVARYSAVAIEAVANGIPLVVPAKTTMSRLLDTHGNPGTCFDNFEPLSIVDATRRALANFDEISARAETAAAQWSANMGTGNMVTALLARGGFGVANGP